MTRATHLAGAVSAFVCAVALGGCGGAGSAQSLPVRSSPTASPTPIAKPTATATPTATPVPQRLYVATVGNTVPATVLYLTAPFSATSPATTAITLSATDSIAGLLVGPGGNVLVSDYSNGTLSSYSRPAPATAKQFSLLTNGYGIAFDGAGTLYAAVSNSDQIVTAPAPLSATSTFTPLGASGEDAPWAIAFDGADNMYVSNYSNGAIDAYAPPYNGAPFATIPTGGSGLGSTIVYDASTNQIIAILNTGALVYNLPVTSASTPSATIAAVRFFEAGAAAVDTSGNLYVGSTISTGPAVVVFKPPFSNSSAETLAIPVPYQPTAMAFGT